MVDFKLALLVESWGEPWNEGYKNLARYIYMTLKDDIDINVYSYHDSKALIGCSRYDAIWIFNYPENLKTLPYLINLRRKCKAVIKEVAKKELDIDLKSKVRTLLLRKRLWKYVVTTSSILKSELVRFFEEPQVQYYPPPIPIDYFKHMSKREARKALGFVENKIYIGYTGRINRYRRLSIVLEALKGVGSKNVTLVLSLTGLENGYKEISRLIRESIKLPQLQVKFVRINNVRLFYSALDLLIYPVERQGAIEPPLTILECMSCGTPVAALKNPTLKEIITNYQDGFVFTNAHELKNIITDVLEGTVDLKKLGAKSREKIHGKYSLEKLRSTYLRFLEFIDNETCY